MFTKLDRRALFSIVVLLVAGNSSAQTTITHYTDLAAFEAAAGAASVVIDDFNDLSFGLHSQPLDRGSYILDGADPQVKVYNVAPGNTAPEYDDAANPFIELTFDEPVVAFGFVERAESSTGSIWEGHTVKIDAGSASLTTLLENYSFHGFVFDAPGQTVTFTNMSGPSDLRDGFMPDNLRTVAAPAVPLLGAPAVVALAVTFGAAGIARLTALRRSRQADA